MVKSSEILYVHTYMVVGQQKELTFVNSSLISSVLIQNHLQLFGSSVDTNIGCDNPVITFFSVTRALGWFIYARGSCTEGE
jgi:hypothetical protein